MSVELRLPFEPVLHLSGQMVVDADRISLRKLRNVVAGKDTTISRSHAIALLQLSDFPNKHRDFQALLEEEKESPSIRLLAAIALGRINNPAVVNILIKNSSIRNERILSAIAMSLGRIGKASSLDALQRIKNSSTGIVASSAEFAATLISHRLGLEEENLPIPKLNYYPTLESGGGRPLQIMRTDYAEAELCLRSLSYDPFGIEFSETMYRVQLDRCVFVIVFNHDFIGEDAVDTLRIRKLFPAVVAIKSEESGLYSISYLVLTSPDRKSGGFNIVIYSARGSQILGGTGRVLGKKAIFAIRSVSRRGSFPLEMRGSFENGRLEFETALTSMSFQGKQQPTHGLRSE